MESIHHYKEIEDEMKKNKIDIKFFNTLWFL